MNCSSESRVSWDDVEPIALTAFNIWVGQPELRWAEDAWGKLADAGLTAFDSNVERARVFGRFIVLATFYRDWCAVAFEERHDDEELDSWLQGTEIEAVHFGQAIGPQADVEDLSDALLCLVRRERDLVVHALVSGFGGVSGLFVSLWRSNEEHRWKFDDDLDDEDDAHEGRRRETDAEILNNVTSDKLAAWTWISQGCDYLGPFRGDS